MQYQYIFITKRNGENEPCIRQKLSPGFVRKERTKKRIDCYNVPGISCMANTVHYTIAKVPRQTKENCTNVQIHRAENSI